MENVENIFYNEIIQEAATGYVDCDFFIPICFETKELKNNVLESITTAKYFPNVMTPTLLIKDRTHLTDSIRQYVELAREFYKNDARLIDMDEHTKDKYIISSLLANTLVTDFNDIDSLFVRHSNFLKDDSFFKFLEPQNIGYSSILESNVMVEVEKQSIVEETPYGLKLSLQDEQGNTTYVFPIIRFGISDNKAYIYAVQGMEDNNNKKIERKLRKIGEGFAEGEEEKDPVNYPENLYSVSPWAIAALSIAVPFIRRHSGIEEFVAPYFLVNRWNAVEISYEILKEQYKGREEEDKIKKVLSRKEEMVVHHDDIQRNITDKFIRNFRRLDHHFSNINIDSFPLEMDSSLHFTVDSSLQCNNHLLEELYLLGGGGIITKAK